MLKKIPYSLPLIFSLLLGFSLGVVWDRNVASTAEIQSSTEGVPTIIREEGDFTLVSKYIDDNKWEYHITGSMDNQCPKADSSVEVIESDPQLVKVKMVIYKPEDNSLCAQTIKSVDESGAFEATSEAVMEFVIVEDDSRSTITGLPVLEE